MNYTVWDKSGILNINTKSPNSKFYYRIRSLYEAKWGILACDLAFYSISGEFLHRIDDGSVAADLDINSGFHNVLWLERGDKAFYIQIYNRSITANVLDLTNARHHNKSLTFEDSVVKKEISMIKSASLQGNFQEVLVNYDVQGLNTNSPPKFHFFNRWRP